MEGFHEDPSHPQPSNPNPNVCVTTAHDRSPSRMHPAYASSHVPGCPRGELWWQALYYDLLEPIKTLAGGEEFMVRPHGTKHRSNSTLVSKNRCTWSRNFPKNISESEPEPHNWSRTRRAPVVSWRCVFIFRHLKRCAGWAEHVPGRNTCFTLPQNAGANAHGCWSF